MNRKRILLIDDDKPLTEAVKINLEATGDYEVAIENQSVRALGSVRDFRPDLIVLDYIMPGADGGDVSRRLHADLELNQIPIIMLTALISNEETGAEGSAHRNGHVMMAKPVRISKLIHCIEEQLTASHAGV